MQTQKLNTTTTQAAHLFIKRISKQYLIKEAILYGSRARYTHRMDSDMDIAIILREPHGKRSAIAIDMAGVAFDVLLETGILIEALPL